jgi:23S rRNA (cytosine1962-C5)-methyltransferase
MPSEKDLEQGRFFSNRVAKRDKHLGKFARRTGSDCYRVYDRDIPEIPLALDRYGAAAVLQLFERPYDKPESEEAAWLELMADASAAALGMDRKHIHIKTRKRLGIDEQYGVVDAERHDQHGTTETVVRELGLSFMVNLVDYIDTGLFMDHRPARALVRSISAGKRVLNLFCYTGSFSVYALAGDASLVVGVDLSKTYLAWADRNIALNGFDLARYRGVRSDVSTFLAESAAAGARYDIIVLDPPTFSNSKKMVGFLDISRHWTDLVRSCLSVLDPLGVILFSSNARSLRVDPGLVPDAAVLEISDLTIPEDFRGHPHRSWLITHGAISPTRFFPRGQAGNSS